MEKKIFKNVVGTIVGVVLALGLVTLGANVKEVGEMIPYLPAIMIVVICSYRLCKKAKKDNK